MKQLYLKTLVLLLMCVVGVNAFAYDCVVNGIYYNLNQEEMTAEVTYKDHYNNPNYNPSYSGDVVIPSEILNGPTDISDYINENYTYRVTSIGDYAFYRCTDLTSIVIGNSVTTIGSDAFYGCTGLTSIIIGNSVTSIPLYSFHGCNNLTSITFHCEEIKDWFSEINNNIKSVVIGEEVTSIGENAFNWFRGLTSITIPNSVTSIGNGAFRGCRSLTSVTIPNSVTSIGKDAYYQCTSLISVIIPNSVTSIGEAAFYGCSSLTSVTIPNSVNSIGNSTFSGCTGLTSVTIPNSVTDIGSSAFRDCTGLTSVTIPNSVTSIGYSAFADCSGLTSVTIPNSVTSIGESAFYDCTGLTRVDYSSLEHLCSIEFGNVKSSPLYYARHLYINDEELKDNLVIPETVTSIGIGAFNGCLLKNVMLKHQTPPTVSTLTFSDPTRYHATLYVSAGTWESYAYDDGWYTFINIRETATEEAQLRPTLSYTLMDARTFSYMVYDPVNNGVSTITSVGIDENNPNHSWQTLVVEGERYLYNIGARKFAVPSADGKSLELSDKAGSLSITDGQDGLLFDNQTDRQWALVVNEKMTVDSHAEEAVTSSVSSMRVDPINATSVCYGIDGRRQNTSQRGLNIIRMSDGTVKKVMVK